ncbi:MAG: hypothetical protein HOE90_05000 [Bacteriovoracaceae bacterium]|jgi:hypothetical protein|nr:hypothetical protein [Bacteriovoracaceae bacterium]
MRHIYLAIILLNILSVASAETIRAYHHKFPIKGGGFIVKQIYVSGNIYPSIKGSRLSASCRAHRIHESVGSSRMRAGDYLDVKAFGPTYDFSQLPELAKLNLECEKRYFQKKALCTTSYINRKGIAECREISVEHLHYCGERDQLKAVFEEQKVESKKLDNYLIELENGAYIACEGADTTRNLAIKLGNSLTLYLENIWFGHQIH